MDVAKQADERNVKLERMDKKFLRALARRLRAQHALRVGTPIQGWRSASGAQTAGAEDPSDGFRRCQTA